MEIINTKKQRVSRKKQLKLLENGISTTKSFHPYGLLVTQNEKSSDFQFMFQTLKDLIKTVNGLDYCERDQVGTIITAIIVHVPITH